MKDVCYLKKSTSFLDYGGGGAIFYVLNAFCIDDVKWLHFSELLVLISIAFGFLLQIKYWYDTTLCGFWL